MVKLEIFIYNGADQTLSERGLYQEVKNILRTTKSVDHKVIQSNFYDSGWILEKRIFPEASWAWDAYKDKTAVSIELSLIDAVHRDFLRAILANKRGELDVLVYVTSTFKEPKFHNVKRDISIFGDLLVFPILLIGLA